MRDRAERKRFQIPFQIAENYNPRESYFDFWLGFDPQVIEVGGVKIEKQEQGFNVQGIETGNSYQGRESGAPWRRDAAERIDKHRKADFHFTVTDASDTPLPATVQVRMKRHSFESACFTPLAPTQFPSRPASCTPS